MKPSGQLHSLGTDEPEAHQASAKVRAFVAILVAGIVVFAGAWFLDFDGDRVYRGANTTGEILFTVSGNRIFVGGSTSDPQAYTVTNGRVYEGSRTGPIIYTIEGDRMFEGAHATGDIVFQANTELSGDIQFLLPILADLRF